MQIRVRPQLETLNMAQQQLKGQSVKWKQGQKCEIYSRLQRRWIEGEVIDIFEDEEGEWVKVKYERTIKEIPPNDPDIRPIESKKEIKDPNRERAIVSREAKVTSTVDELIAKFKPLLKEVIGKSHDLKKEEVKGPLSWYNVMQCVRHEMYPMMAVSLSKAVEEMVFSSGFAVGDLSEEAVQRVIAMLKTKKVLFGKEIEYIQGLVDRARAFKWEQAAGTMHSEYLSLSTF